MIVCTGVVGVIAEDGMIVVVTWETDGRMTLIFATILHSGHNNLVHMRENTTALGDTMVSVLVDMKHVMTRVTKSFILDSLVCHRIEMVGMFSTALALVLVLLVMMVPVVTQPIPGVARMLLAIIKH